MEYTERINPENHEDGTVEKPYVGKLKDRFEDNGRPKPEKLNNPFGGQGGKDEGVEIIQDY